MTRLRRRWLVASALAAGVAGSACTQMIGIEELRLREPDAAPGTDAGAEADAIPGMDVSSEADASHDSQQEAGPDSPQDDSDAVAGCPLGSKSCAGQCVPTDQPATGCDQPGCLPCVFSHASAICESNGACALSHCVLGWEDCDGQAANGCEAELKSDEANCGGCGKKCAFANAIGQCMGGACVFSACLADWADCDGDSANGCETQTSATVTSCGACGNGCSFQHAGAECVAGLCKLGACDTDFLDCDGDPSTGCEVFAPTSVDHCGSCDKPCDPGSATPACAGGQCVADACPAGLGDCDGAKENGCETDLAVSPQNCGACGYSCSFAKASALCVAGVCAIGDCLPGFGNCDANASNGCETDTGTSPEHCGKCAKPCASVPYASIACVNGACESTCQVGRGDCDGDVLSGCETDLMVSVLHCGACGRACSGSGVASRQCAAGACESTCQLGASNCKLPMNSPDDGCETKSSDKQCGSCDNDCSMLGGGFVCGGGGRPSDVCSCDKNSDCNPKSGTGTCSSAQKGLCVCGGADCNRGEHCVFDTTASKDLCSCNGGAGCAAGETCCLAGCRNISTDAQSCGACGRACPEGFTCVDGACGCSGDGSCGAGSPGTCTARACVCGTSSCAAGKRCLPDGSCG